MAGEGCWEALPSVLKLEDLLSPSWRKFETSFERERQSRYKKYITHCRHVHRLIVHGLLRCCGFFPLQCRVDSFHSAAHRRRRSRCHRHRRRHRDLLLSCIGSCMRAARRTRGASQPADYTDNHKELTLLPAHQITPCRTQAHTPQATCSTAMWCRAQVTASAVPKRRRRLRSSSAWWC